MTEENENVEADEILSGKKMEKEEQKENAILSTGNETMTCWDILNDPSLSIYNLYDRDRVGEGIDFNEIMHQKRLNKPNPRPYVAINDLNNSDDEPYLNKPKPAIEIGIKVDF